MHLPPQNRSSFNKMRSQILPFALFYLAAVGRAIQFTAPSLPFVADHTRSLQENRYLALSEDSQCFIDSVAINKEIANRGAALFVNADCADSNYCAVTATDDPLYEDFLDACEALNGDNYTYNLECDIVLQHDAGTESVTYR